MHEDILREASIRDKNIRLNLCDPFGLDIEVRVCDKNIGRI
jgi:hypothetical protein